MINYIKKLRRQDYIAFFVLIAIAIIFIRCFNLQYIENNKYSSKINKRDIKTHAIKAVRGTIYDRNDVILAESILVDTLGVTNTKEFFSNEDKDIKKLCKILNIEYKNLVKDLSNKKNKKFRYIERRLPPEVVEKISSLGLKGIGFQKEFKRFYPGGEVIANLIGMTDSFHNGEMGLEKSFNKILKEKDGEKIFRIDERGRTVANIGIVSPPKEGKKLVLTIDIRLQYVAYRELRKQIESVNAKSGSVVILDSTNGDILASASYPSYDPSDKNSYTPEKERNKVIIDSLEPASTIKPFLLTAALHSEKVNLKNTFNTNPGWIKFGKKKYSDTKNNGILTAAEVVVKSSNVGSILISQKFDKEIYHDLLEYVGIGDMVNINFPGEIEGKLDHHSEWGNSAIISHSIGYAFKVTPLQLAKAYSVIANEGVVINPRIIKSSIIQKNKIQKYKNSFIEVKNVIRKVVENGSGKNAAIKGYSVGGKTGTAELYVGGNKKKYNKDEHVSLFAGITPITKPKLVIVVVINEPKTKPKGFFGGYIAAPVFSKIATDSLRILNVSPDNILDYQKTVSIKTPEVQDVF